MADKILMNKNSLATLKNELKEYESALPVFEMKEQQLKKAVESLENSIQKLEQSIEESRQKTKKWVAVMSEESVDLQQLAVVNRVKTNNREIAGVRIDVFSEIDFEEVKLDPLESPLWLDAAKEVISDQKTKYTMIEIERHNIELLREELAEARRMKNALKEVFIPETKQKIRKIEIYLGDVERLAIGCAKLVKKKKEKKKATL
ncbi:MAG TPA: V-type ATP synthase subunit D [Saprospiraceae bacterium]|nr:V-type ATP synthase subunit D [Saprospiraceae bacterium]